VEAGCLVLATFRTGSRTGVCCDSSASSVSLSSSESESLSTDLSANPRPSDLEEDSEGGGESAMLGGGVEVVLAALGRDLDEELR
jgi:hypothetical protein